MMTPKEKTEQLLAYCRANVSPNTRFEWKNVRVNCGPFPPKWMFRLTLINIPPIFTDAWPDNRLSRVFATKHEALDWAFKLIMDSRKLHDLETVSSFDELAIRNAVAGIAL